VMVVITIFLVTRVGSVVGSWGRALNVIGISWYMAYSTSQCLYTCKVRSCCNCIFPHSCYGLWVSYEFREFVI